MDRVWKYNVVISVSKLQRNMWKRWKEVKMFQTLPPLSCESSVSLKENPDRLKKRNPFVPIAPFLLPLKNVRKPEGFLIISGVRGRVHWEQMG